MTNTTIHIIDAEGKRLGRIATDAARHLIGKTTPAFQRNAITGEKVRIINASKVHIEPKKLTDKVYKRYSGYPGGLKERRMEEVIAIKGYKEIFVKAIHGMVPANRLRAKIMKNLEVTD